VEFLGRVTHSGVGLGVGPVASEARSSASGPHAAQQRTGTLSRIAPQRIPAP